MVKLGEKEKTMKATAEKIGDKYMIVIVDTDNPSDWFIAYGTKSYKTKEGCERAIRKHGYDLV